MTINELQNAIKWLGDEMNFCIEDVFSWRGAYAEPACEISTRRVSKQHNLDMINRLLTETFRGYKGGEYTYNEIDDIHFECEPGAYSDGKYLNKFLLDNSDNKDVYEIFT